VKTHVICLLLVPGLFLGTLGSATGHAATSVFTSKSSWTAAVNLFSTETFDNGPFGTYGSIVPMNADMDIIAHNHGFIPDTSKTWHDQIDVGGDPTVFHFHHPIYAFGADWDLTSYWIGTPNHLRVYLDGTAAGSDIVGDGFFGVVSTTAFTDATVQVVTGSYQNWDIDNLVYANAVPEPSGLILALTGLVLAVFAAHRWPHQARELSG